MLAAVSQSLRFLLEEAEFLKVVRRKADQVALSRNCDLQCLPNPPRCIGRQPGAVANVEPVDCLHQAANRFLEQVGIAEGMMAKTFGHVSGQANVCGCEAVFVM